MAYYNVGAAALSAASSLFGADSSSNGAKEAAEIQAKSAAASLAQQKSFFNINQQNQAPFINNGVAASTKLRNMLGLGGQTNGNTTRFDQTGYDAAMSKYNDGLNATAPTAARTDLDPEWGFNGGAYPIAAAAAVAPTRDQYTTNDPTMASSGQQTAGTDGTLGGSFTGNDYLANKDPGYEFQRQQGEQALQNSQAAHDGVLSGSALKGLINYNQGAASTGYQSAYDRWLKSQQNTYNQLNGQATIGANAAAGLGSDITKTGANMGETIVGQGNAQASGAVASANAWSKGVSGAVSPFMLRNFMSPNDGTPQGGFQNNVQGATGDFARLDRSNYNAY